MIADIIPTDFFTNIPAGRDWILWLLTVGGIGLLMVGADWVVAGAVRLAAAMGMSTVLIGATVVSLGTTSPEATVSVSAAWSGNPGLALGNGVGSIICDTALIFGLSCVLTRIPLDKFVLHRQGVLKILTGVLLAGVVVALAAASGTLGAVAEAARGFWSGPVTQQERGLFDIPRWVGVTFLGLLVLYMVVSVHWGRQHPSIIPDEAKVAVAPTHRGRAAVRNLLLAAIGLAVVIFASDLLKGSVIELCHRYEVPPEILAVTVVAFGTSLPEFATAMTAIRRGHPELLVGNVIGADILNVLFVIGASATAAPLAVSPSFIYLHLPVMLVAIGLMGGYIFTSGKTFRRWQGVPLLAVYVAYCVILVVKFGPQL